MSNKIGSLEEIETRDYNYAEIAEIGEVTNLTTIYSVDFINKRRAKDSIPSLILAEIEGTKKTAKEIENSLFRKNNKGLRKAKEKLGPEKDFRAYLSRRITAVFRYYLNNDVIAEIGARAVYREVIEGKAFYSLTSRFIPTK